MPKFLTYQRPAPISRSNWNGAPNKKPLPPRREPSQPVPANRIDLPQLEQIIRKE